MYTQPVTSTNSKIPSANAHLVSAPLYAAASVRPKDETSAVLEVAIMTPTGSKWERSFAVDANVSLTALAGGMFEVPTNAGRELSTWLLATMDSHLAMLGASLESLTAEYQPQLKITTLTIEEADLIGQFLATTSVGRTETRAEVWGESLNDNAGLPLIQEKASTFLAQFNDQELRTKALNRAIALCYACQALNLQD